MVSAVEKLTRAQVVALRAANQEKYGLSAEQVDAIVLPSPDQVKFFEPVDKIVNPMRFLSGPEKLEKLDDIKRWLELKLAFAEKES